MTTSKQSGYRLCSLFFETTKNYKSNLQTLLNLVKGRPKRSIIVAPEVCLTGFDYENYDEAVAFSCEAISELKKASKDKIIILTMLEKKDNEVFNFAKIFHNGEVVYERAKAKLFRFGDEHKHMSEGSAEEIKIVEIEGIKIGVLICFELRFKEFWQKLEGCDVIAAPSWWGVLRTEHFRVITQALAVINQCYVVASDSQNEECTKISTVITPNGKNKIDENRVCSELQYDKKEIVKMRRYMDVGIG
jgi:predicted amidohydrolase